jgi:hypothetical protein
MLALEVKRKQDATSWQNNTLSQFWHDAISYSALTFCMQIGIRKVQLLSEFELSSL